MKKEWQKPELQALEVAMTMLHPNNGDNLDHAYPEGTPRSQLTWS